MEQNCKKSGKVWIVAAALVVAAFAIGISVYQGLKKVSMGERVVTVKGKAEMDVKADVASMSISFSVKKNTLNELLADAKAKKAIWLMLMTDMQGIFFCRKVLHLKQQRLI